MIAKLFSLVTASLLSCSPSDVSDKSHPAEPAKPSPAPAPASNQPRRAEDLARDFLAFLERAPTPDSFTRYIAEMADKLTDFATPGGDPNAKIDCAGSYENSSCWNVSCSCDTLNSCSTLSAWCGAVGGKESGLSCAASSKGGCP